MTAIANKLLLNFTAILSVVSNFLVKLLWKLTDGLVESPTPKNCIC